MPIQGTDDDDDDTDDDDDDDDGELSIRRIELGNIHVTATPFGIHSLRNDFANVVTNDCEATNSETSAVAATDARELINTTRAVLLSNLNRLIILGKSSLVSITDD